MQESRTFIGRTSELESLKRTIALAHKGKTSVTLLSGEAGVGKTRLATEALADSDVVVCMGRAREESTPPYGPIAMALRECLRGLKGGADTLGSLTSHLGAILPEIPEPPNPPEREQLIASIAAAFEKRAQRQTVALFLDDLQWADNASLETIPLLTDRLAGRRILVLGTYRSDDIARGHPLRRLRSELRRAHQIDEIPLNPLDERSTSALVAHVLGVEPNEHLVSVLYERSQGVPLYVEELARALQDNDRLVPSGETVDLVEGEDVPIPESIRDAILLRLEKLSDAAQRHMHLAAVAGLDFELDMLPAILGTDAGLAELFDNNLLLESSPGRATFGHTLIRDAIRAEITWSQRRTLHREVAQYLDNHNGAPELIAEHWLAANELQPARMALLESADRSCRIHAYHDAARAAHRALEIWPENEEEERRLNALQHLAHCAQVSGQINDALKAWREVLQSPLVADDHSRRGDALRSLATLYSLQAAWQQAIDTRRQAANALQQAGRTADAASELLAAAARLTATIQLNAALDLAREAADLARQANAPDIESRAVGLQGDIVAQLGNVQEGRDTAQAGLSLALKHNLTEAASDVYRRLASTLAYASDYPAAREAYDTAINFCREQGVEVHAQVCLGCLSYVLFQTGEWKRALEVLDEVRTNPETPVNSKITADGMLGIIKAYRGEIKPARSLLEKSLVESKRRDITIMQLLGAGALALLAEYDGNKTEAERRHREVLDGWQTTREQHDLIPGLCHAATFFATEGFNSEAGLCAEALSAIAASTGNPEALAGLAYALGELALADDNADEAAKQFRQALTHLEKLEIPLARAHTDYRAGIASARSGDDKAAIEHFSRAYKISRGLGCRPLAGQIARELERLGEPVTERRSADTSERQAQAGLTRRQLEILNELAAGLTNKEIAKKLFLSPRTVDMHVGNILARLDCRSRTEAVRRASDLNLLD